MFQEACLSESEILTFVADMLAGKESGPPEQHVRGCSDCARIVDELARVSVSSTSLWYDQLRPRLLRPGDVVAARYLIRRSIGVGAMGEVHEVQDQFLGKTVALKTLNARLAGDEGALKRLKDEVALAHKVTHPHVCRVFDLGIDKSLTSDGRSPLTFLTMEYLEGETLTAFLRGRGPLARDLALELLTQLAAGLAAAHAEGVIHRDLKGDNVMLVPRPRGSPRAVMTDFGLAAAVIANDPGRSTCAAFSGTPQYAAPERLAGHRATPTSDVYSFGLIAMEMLTGSPSPRPSSWAPNSSSGGYGRPSAFTIAVAQLGRDWERLMLQMTDPVPSRRLPDGQTVLAALHKMNAHPAAWALRGPLRLPTWIGLLGLVVVTTNGINGIQPSAIPARRAGPFPNNDERTADSCSDVAEPSPSDRETRSRSDTAMSKAREAIVRSPSRSHPPRERRAADSSPSSRTAASFGHRVDTKTAASDIVRDLGVKPSDAPGRSELVDPFRPGYEASLGSIP